MCYCNISSYLHDMSPDIAFRFKLSFQVSFYVHVQDPTKHSACFVSGPSGTGRTTVYEVLLASVRSLNRVVLAVASSSVVALLLDVDGSTQSK